MERIFPPSRYDNAEYKTICQVRGETKLTYYIQISKDPDRPIWLTLGEFFEKTFNHRIHDSIFIDECLKYFEAKNEL